MCKRAAISGKIKTTTPVMPHGHNNTLIVLVQGVSNEYDRIEQVLQLDSCREHWIQAEISLHAWFEENNIEIWTDLPIGDRRKADLYAIDKSESTTMVAELKCLGDISQAKCLEGSWSVRADIDRLRSFDCRCRQR